MLKLFFKGICVTLLSSLLSLVLVFMCILFMNNTFFKVVIGLCTLFILIGLHINFSYSEALKKDSKSKNERVSKKTFVMSISACFPLLVEWVILMMSKIGVVSDFLPFYKLFNEHFLLITAFYCDKITAQELGWAMCLFLLFSSFLPFIPIYITYSNFAVRNCVCILKIQ